jgi:hypothetical protein
MIFRGIITQQAALQQQESYSTSHHWHISSPTRQEEHHSTPWTPRIRRQIITLTPACRL